MNLLRTLRKLILGETWILPLGLALLLAGALLLREAAPDAWTDAGGFALLAGAAAVVVVSVSRSARRG